MKTPNKNVNQFSWLPLSCLLNEVFLFSLIYLTLKLEYQYGHLRSLIQHHKMPLVSHLSSCPFFFFFCLVRYWTGSAALLAKAASSNRCSKSRTNIHPPSTQLAQTPQFDTSLLKMCEHISVIYLIINMHMLLNSNMY